MKKRIIISNIATISMSLFVLFIISLLTIIHINLNNTKKELINYLDVATTIFNGNNEEELINSFSSNKSIRISIIDKSGNVISDSSNEVENVNHLERPEIIDLGSIHYRYSNSLKIKMMYVAALDNNYYVRVAIPQRTIDSFVEDYFSYGIIAMIVLLVLSSLVISSTTKKSFFKLRTQVNKLSRIVNKEENIIGDDVEFLSKKIDDVSTLINNKIKLINSEKNKLKFIFDNLNIGLIVINSEKKIEIVNKVALDIFQLNSEVIDKDYIYVSRSFELQNNIHEALTSKKQMQYEEEVNEKYYMVRINSIDNLWDDSNNFGVVVNYINITDLKKLEKTKKEFFANASHELKSPLTSIIGYQQMIKEGIVTTSDEIADATSKTINEANRMNKIIIEMLALSKLESNYPSSLENIDVKKIIEDVLLSYENDIDLENLKINLKLESKTLNINRLDITMLIKNIIENAIKYNKPNGSIEIILRDNYFSVKDSGIGISADNQKHIFERFYRVDKGVSRSKNGTGLGLAIVKHICLNYGFEINVDSMLGEGTTVKIMFK